MEYTLVIGGNGLIGSAVVNELAEGGRNIIAVDMTYPEKDFQGSVKSIVHDIGDVGGLKSFLEKLLDEYNITELVNVSFPRGKGWKRSPDEITPEEFMDNINKHMNSYCLLALYYCQMSRERKVEARVVNVASIFGVVSPPAHLYNWVDSYPAIPYPAIKGGIISFSVYLAGKFGKDNIRINCISPGVVTGSGMEGKNDFIDGMKKNMLGRTAIPREIAKPIKFLLSKDSSFITGQNLIVDGGWTNM